MIISVQNELDSLPEVQLSFLSANVNSGTINIPVKNINFYNDGWAIQLGKTGEAESEIALISGAPTNGTITLSGNLIYNHSIDTPVYQIHYDQIIFERSVSGTTGTAVGIGTVPITPNSQWTEFNDSSGSIGYAYKTKFYNSQTSDISDESDWFVLSSPTFYSLQSMRERAQDALHNANYIKSDDTIRDWINEWIEVMNNAAIKVNQGYSMGTADIPLISNGTVSLGTVTDPLFKQMNKIEVTYDGNTFSNSQEIEVNRYSMGDSFSSLSPRHSWQSDNVFAILPAGSGGIAHITYSMLPQRLIEDTDELPISLRSYTTPCIEYLLYKAYDNDLKDAFAEAHYQKFVKGQGDFIHEVTPRDQSGIKTIDFTEALSGGQDTIDIVSDFII